LLGGQPRTVIAPKLYAAALGSRESGLRAFGDSAALILDHDRHDADGQPFGSTMGATGAKWVVAP
jgi:hypothetical protein